MISNWEALQQAKESLPINKSIEETIAMLKKNR